MQKKKKKLYPLKFVEGNSLLDSDSVISNGFLAENSMDDVIETYLADLLGPKVLEYYRGELPVTVRVIDAEQPLPVMACPDDTTARERYLVWGRPFLWYFSNVGPGARVYYGFKEQMSAETLYNAVVEGTLRDKMYSFVPHEGDSLFVRGGMPFSAEGMLKIVEIAGNSPVTYHLEQIPELGEAMDILDYSPAGGVNSEVGDCHFVVNLRNISRESRVEPSAYDSFIIYVCVGGQMLVRTNDGTEYHVGNIETVFIPESMEDFALVPAGGKPVRLLEIFMTRLDEPVKDSYIDDEAGDGHCHGHHECGCHDHGCTHDGHDRRKS